MENTFSNRWGGFALAVCGLGAVIAKRMLSEDNVNRQDTGELSSRKQSMFEGESYIYIYGHSIFTLQVGAGFIL